MAEILRIEIAVPTDQVERDQAARALRKIAHLVRAGEEIPRNIEQADGTVIGLVWESSLSPASITTPRTDSDG